MKFTFDSVIFKTRDLRAIRSFYEQQLGFPTGTYEKNGVRLPDHSDLYVNYHIGGGLIGFEVEAGGSIEPDKADLVIRVQGFEEFKSHVEDQGIELVHETQIFFMIKDPDGRTLIFEPAR